MVVPCQIRLGAGHRVHQPNTAAAVRVLQPAWYRAFLLGILDDAVLDLEQTAFDCGGTAQPPQQAGQTQHQFAFDSSLRIKFDRYRPFERLVLPRAFEDSITTSAVSPWRTELRRDRRFPAAVFGPVLLSALRRLASICLSELTGAQS
jgi:hypothetical protein